jgi:TadE-like protein
MDSSERGVALLEFCLVLPFLVILAIGAVDIGRGLLAHIELEEAAQEGALYGSFAPNNPGLIETRVRTSSTGLVNLSDTSVVQIEVACPEGNRKVAVILEHTHQLFTPILGPLLGGSIPMGAQAVGTNFTDATCTPS